MFLSYKAVSQRIGVFIQDALYFKQSGLYETSFLPSTQAATIETKTSFLPSAQAVTMEANTSFLPSTQAVTMEMKQCVLNDNYFLK